MPVPKHPKSRSFLSRGLFRDIATFTELERRISGLPSNQERGDAFEVFAEAYIATQAACQATAVWPFERIPSELRQKHALDTARDMGVDGVYETTLGELNAYQVKFRTGRTNLTWEELSTFMGLTEQVHQRVLFTNSDELPSLMDVRKGFFCIRGSDLDRLERRDFEAMLGWLGSGRLVYERKNPREHQAQAITVVTAALHTDDRATMVMACGTGKTLIALWVAEAMGVDTVLVLVPSLALVRQTLHEWVKETHWERFAFLCVCSDPSVAKADDDIVVRQADLDFPVTTDSATVRTFLGAGAGVRVVFSTYQSAEVVAHGMPAGFGFDLGIFDEAHKTAGREGTRFSFALRDENLSICKRLFMTATPRHYDIRKRDKEGDARLVYSMDTPETYGARAFALPFGDAAKRDIICGYKVVISVATTAMVNEERRRRGEVVVEGDVVQAQQVANQIALQKAVEQYGIRKAFTFHSSVKSAKSFVAEGGEGIGVHLPSFATYHVNGDMPTSVRDGFIKAFRDADRAIITNARCLTEGVDVPAVDMVAFLAPKKSKVDIVQATGRAMRKSSGKTYGYILVPLYLEQFENETLEEALRRSNYGDIWAVLQAMQEQDEELAEIIRAMREERGRTKGFDDSRLRERVAILGPQIALHELGRGICAAIVDRLGLSWDERFGQLVAYRSEHGDCNVPGDYGANPALGVWVGGRRFDKAKGYLSEDRIQRLESIGFTWNVHTDSWQRTFLRLVEYKSTFGDFDVPDDVPQFMVLKRWLKQQRVYHAKGQLSEDRERRLEEIGLNWTVRDPRWQLMLAKLSDFRKAHGHANVPQKWSGDPELANWVVIQRRARTRGKRSADRIQVLDAVGFIWDRPTATWFAKYDRLVNYRKRFGDCNVPSAFPDDPELSTWVVDQRKRRKQGKLSKDRQELLSAIGFRWDNLDVWEVRYLELQAYQNLHGSFDKLHSRNRVLSNWVADQRRRWRLGELSEEIVRRLETAGVERGLKRPPRLRPSPSRLHGT